MNRPLRRTCKIALLGLAVLCGVLFSFTFGQAQSANSSSAKLMPALPMGPLSAVPTPPVPGLSTYIKSQTAAIALGKALFWDQQVGSDGVQGCASCHFNAGADSRAINQVDPGLRDKDPASLNFDTFTLGVQLGSPQFYPNYQLHAGTPTAGFGGYHDGDFPLHKPVSDQEAFPGLLATVDHHDVISSQGVFPTKFNGVIQGSSIEPSLPDTDAFFNYPDPTDPTGTTKIYVRRVPPRNTPSAINAVFNYRNFWDGRARNTCNGANPFGERDTTSHFFLASSTTAMPTPGLVRLQNSALCSQALGPPGSNFEMSGAGRGFRDIGRKMLSLNPLSGGPLAGQLVDPQDSVLGRNSKSPKRGLNTTYPAMIKNAFQPVWWQSTWHICISPDGSQEALINPAAGQVCSFSWSEYTQMEYNFSLFWGLAVQAYESTLRADQTPFDQYLAQQKVFVVPANNVTNSFSFKLAKGIVPQTVSVQAFNPALDVSDQDVFAFDNGVGGITGIGIVSGSVNYATGQVSLTFELPPPTGFPTKVAYSLGNSTPLTPGQLHGLLVFETKGRCIVCHGGPELTNASVAHEGSTPLERMIMGDFTIRVYDSGFYHIGTRPGHEDIGLADLDGIPTSGLPLSDAATAQKQLCDATAPGFPIGAPTIPGRRGDGIPTAPLTCLDQISQRGMVKAPGLRNLALTAPYFHNGGQLTLEQVVEFYDRGGDFGLLNDEKNTNPELLPDGELAPPAGACDPNSTALVNCLMDPNVELLGLTQQEKTDLVDFLRAGLLDSRVLYQMAPFDHPSLNIPNGQVIDPQTGYPMPDPNHPGQALDQYITIPQNGKAGALPLPTFLQNLAKP